MTVHYALISRFLILPPVFDLYPPLSDVLSSGTHPFLFLTYELWHVHGIGSFFTLFVSTTGIVVVFVVIHATYIVESSFMNWTLTKSWPLNRELLFIPVSRGTCKEFYGRGTRRDARNDLTMLPVFLGVVCIPAVYMHVHGHE